MTTASRYEIIATPAGRHLVNLDGRQIADCKTPQAAQRVIDHREADLAGNASRREESAARHREEEAETRRLVSSLDWGRVRKTVSSDPGYSVNCLGSRCEAVLDYWGAPVRTCIVLLVAGADQDGTRPLTADDRAQVELDIDCDDETRALVTRHCLAARTVEALWNSRTDTYELHVDPIHAWSDDGDNWMDCDQSEPFRFDRYPDVSIRLVGGPRAGVTVG